MTYPISLDAIHLNPMLLTQCLRESVIQQELEAVEISQEELDQAIAEFKTQQGINNRTDYLMWLDRNNLVSSEAMTLLVTRSLKTQKFKAETWSEGAIGSYFLKRKSSMDRVAYSVIRTTNHEAVGELYFRLAEQESDFAELAPMYSQGPEAVTGGILGPVRMESIHPTIAQMLRSAKVGVVNPPIQVEGWSIILRLESVIPAVLNEQTKEYLLGEMFEEHINAMLKQQIAEKTPVAA